jgi:hypothetical protein
MGRAHEHSQTQSEVGEPLKADRALATGDLINSKRHPQHNILSRRGCEFSVSRTYETFLMPVHVVQGGIDFDQAPLSSGSKACQLL